MNAFDLRDFQIRMDALGHIPGKPGRICLIYFLSLMNLCLVEKEIKLLLLNKVEVLRNFHSGIQIFCPSDYISTL